METTTPHPKIIRRLYSQDKTENSHYLYIAFLTTHEIFL